FNESKTHLHIPYRENKNLTGTTCYTSINTHLGVKWARHDDLESLRLAYILMYFLCGCTLTVLKAAANNKKQIQRYVNRIMEKKMTTLTNILYCSFPNEFSIFLNYTLYYTGALCFDDKPGYSYLYKLFCNPFVHEGFPYDYIFKN
ncbi:hypothetical protein BD769DRAFT_1345842, partial [Suillus cothurnatus]